MRGKKNDGTTRLRFMGWLEVPYPVLIDYDERALALYRRDVEVELRIRLRRDVLKVTTGSRYLQRQLVEAWMESHKGDIPSVLQTRYVEERDVDEVVAELEGDPDVPYAHVEMPVSVIEVSAFLPPNLQIQDEEYFENSVMPHAGFFTREVLSRVQLPIDAYRVAALPSMRYAIEPVSEALIDTALCEIVDTNGDRKQAWFHGFNVRGHIGSMAGHADRLGVRDRYTDFVRRRPELEPEFRFSAAYYLYQMRRWTEALVIAHAVVDQLLTKLISASDPKAAAELLLSAYRNRYRDCFNKVLPALGYDKLSQCESCLWQSFVAARRRRGEGAHGAARARAFDGRKERQVKSDLGAVHDVARWLSEQMGRPWELEVRDGSEVLPSFP